MKLEQLLKTIADVPLGAAGAFEVAGVTSDSRQVREGFVYVAITGGRYDGRDYVEDAATRGAVCCVVEGGQSYVTSRNSLIRLCASLELLSDDTVCATLDALPEQFSGLYKK